MEPKDWFNLPEGVEYMVELWTKEDGWQSHSSILSMQEAKLIARESANNYQTVARIARISRYAWSRDPLVQTIVQVFYPAKRRN